jgi:hypothetical protein
MSRPTRATDYLRRQHAAATRGSDPVRAHTVEGALGYDETWKVFVNVRKDELRASAGVARR